MNFSEKRLPSPFVPLCEGDRGRHQLAINCWIIALLLLFAGSISFSQEKKEPASHEIAVPDSAQAPLPKISLPEFVITGNETIDLPASTKNAEDENMVYVAKPLSPESVRKSAVNDIGGKANKESGTAIQMNGKILAGFGAYTTPFVEGWFGKNYGEGGILFHAQYLATDGHVTDANRTSGGVDLSGDYLIPASHELLGGSKLNGGVSFFGRSYRAYGSATPAQVRSANDIRANIGVSGKIPTGQANSESSLSQNITYSAGIFGRGYSVNDSSTSNESEFGFSGAASAQYENYQLDGNMEYIGGAVASGLPASVAAHSPRWFALRLTGRTMLFSSLQASARLQQFLYRGNLSSGSGRFYPQVDLRYFLNDRTTLFAGVHPTVERTTLRSLFGMNPYITNAVLVEPNDLRLAIEGGAETQFNDRLRGVASVSYKLIRKYTSFLENDAARNWTVIYLPEVHVATFDAQAAYRISDQSSFSASFTVTSATAKDSLPSLPYVPAFRAGGVYHRNFDFGIAVEGYAEYISKQWSDFAHTRANAGYVSAGGRAEYDLHSDVRMFMQVSNLFNQHYYVWDGYLERTFYISLGVTYTW
ncbi:MAG: TonB-dependent receptor [Bacteroidota bacterium]|nr:TonB-dependent receptor [Bacteroidota bacterium]